MQDGWERKVRSSSFFYQNMASRASEKMNISPCPSSSRCWPSSHAAGKRPLLHGIFFLLFSNPPGVCKPPAVPSGASQGAHYPADTRGDIQAVTVCRGHCYGVAVTPRLTLNLRPGASESLSPGPCCGLRVRDCCRGGPGPAPARDFRVLGVPASRPGHCHPGTVPA